MKTTLLSIALFATLLFWSSCKEKSTEPVDEPCEDNIIKLDLGKDTVDYINEFYRFKITHWLDLSYNKTDSFKIDSLKNLTGFEIKFGTLIQQGLLFDDSKQFEKILDSIDANLESGWVFPELTTEQRNKMISDFLKSVNWDNNSVLLTAEIISDFDHYGEYHQFKIEAKLNTCKNIVHFHRTTIYPNGTGGAQALRSVLTLTKIPKMPNDIKVIVTSERISE